MLGHYFDTTSNNTSLQRKQSMHRCIFNGEYIINNNTLIKGGGCDIDALLPGRFGPSKSKATTLLKVIKKMPLLWRHTEYMAFLASVTNLTLGNVYSVILGVYSTELNCQWLSHIRITFIYYWKTWKPWRSPDCWLQFTLDHSAEHCGVKITESGRAMQVDRSDGETWG